MDLRMMRALIGLNDVSSKQLLVMLHLHWECRGVGAVERLTRTRQATGEDQYPDSAGIQHKWQAFNA